MRRVGDYFLALVIFLYIILLAATTIGFNVWLPPCLITWFSGYKCLGCGLTHAGISMLQGNFRAAMEFNSLIFVYLLLAIIYISLKINQHLKTLIR